MNLRDEIVTSKKGEEMLDYILPFYNNDEYILRIFQALGVEFDKLFGEVETFFDEPFPQHATWSLPYWEQLFGLPDHEGKSEQDRRKDVLDYIASRPPINKSRIKAMASRISGAKVIVREFISEYTFHVILVHDDISVINRRIWDAIYEAKPAHLRARYYIKIGDNLYHYDTNKKAIAPVIRFYNNVGNGKRNDVSIKVLNDINKGTYRPLYSGEIIGGAETIAPQSRRRMRDIAVKSGADLGTSNPYNSPMDIAQQGTLRSANLNALINLDIGESEVRFCGVHYAGEGVS